MGKFAASFGHAKTERHSASGGLRPPDPPPGALPLDPRWGLRLQTPVIGSRSSLAIEFEPRAVLNWSFKKPWCVESETRCKIPIWRTFVGEFSGMSSQKPRITLQGVRIQSAILKIVFRHILFFLFLMQFRLRRAAAFVSSPIHLYDLLYYYPYFLFSSSYLTSLLSPVQATPSVIRWNGTTWRAAARGTRRPTTNRQRSTMQCDSCRRGGGFNPQLFGRPPSYHTEIYPGGQCQPPIGYPVQLGSSLALPVLILIWYSDSTEFDYPSESSKLQCKLLSMVTFYLHRVSKVWC